MWDVDLNCSVLQPSQLEQLCINLCSETMQHFYNTHTLKTAIETCRDEGITCGLEVDYADNAHCIDLISSLVSSWSTTLRTPPDGLICRGRVCSRCWTWSVQCEAVRRLTSRR